LLCNLLRLLLNRSNYVLILFIYLFKCGLTYALLFGVFLERKHCGTHAKFAVFPFRYILVFLILVL